MPRLSSASKKAAAAVASKIGGNGSNATPTSNPAPTASAISKTQSDISVPGLINFTPNDIEGSLPSHKDASYQVTDPLNPPESIPQVNQQQFDKSEVIYQGGLRALKLTGLSFDLAKERFTTLKKKVGAVGAGVLLAKEVEKVKGDFLDYLNQVQVTEQKSIALGVSQHKTVTEGQKAIFDIQTMDEKLEQSRIAADLAKLQTQEKLSGLNEFQKQLSGQV